MNNHDVPRKIIDATGVELTPGEPDVCFGNGEEAFTCCCDECDYFLLCFPELDPENKDEDEWLMVLAEKLKEANEHRR